MIMLSIITDISYQFLGLVVLLINVDLLNLFQPIVVCIQILKQKKLRLNLLNLPPLINVDLLNLPQPINEWMNGWTATLKELLSPIFRKY